ncbi:GNAT family N-acetyltransferase [Actinomadura montaniterrae]|uniref:GNAT family N-acetyltransferase n=1 Tax=Actinomadura montaniterrae TaxID=1803903 RepID=A0A6L3VNS9_9ACTN|nr:GNAT family N-acetyltransferase [Actinomadura montaniterrae]KAB2376426.1 GNAT family N-acetyltransferase [Actinomadura montaniterrae]
MNETVTYVEMTDRAQLVAADPVPGLTLDALDRTSPLVPDVLARVGAPYGWKSSRRTPAEWQTWQAENPRRTFGLLTFESDPAGIVAYDPHDHEVEIKSFGLLPDFVGKGLGGYALTLGIQHAWALSPTATRVWLHTSSFDHPNALPNYHRRGFRTYKTEQTTRT